MGRREHNGVVFEVGVIIKIYFTRRVPTGRKAFMKQINNYTTPSRLRRSFPSLQKVQRTPWERGAIICHQFNKRYFQNHLHFQLTYIILHLYAYSIYKIIPFIMKNLNTLNSFRDYIYKMRKTHSHYDYSS